MHPLINFINKHICYSKMIRKSNLQDLINAISFINKDELGGDLRVIPSVSVAGQISYSLMNDSNYLKVAKNKISCNKSQNTHEKSPSSRREAMRQLLKKLKDLLPTPYKNDRMSTAKILTAASSFIKDYGVKMGKIHQEMKNEHHSRLCLIEKLNDMLMCENSPISQSQQNTSPTTLRSDCNSANYKNEEIEMDTPPNARDTNYSYPSYSYKDPNNEIMNGTKVNRAPFDARWYKSRRLEILLLFHDLT
ncbi:hypothetical protein MXB_3090, partial [Myxobolus squamalis]